MTQPKTHYVIECVTTGGNFDSRGQWMTEEGTYRSLKAAREQLEESRTELADEPGKPTYRFRIVRRTVTDEVIED